jgi:hypothetical protein
MARVSTMLFAREKNIYGAVQLTLLMPALVKTEDAGVDT